MAENPEGPPGQSTPDDIPKVGLYFHRKVIMTTYGLQGAQGGVKMESCEGKRERLTFYQSQYTLRICWTVQTVTIVAEY